MTDLQEKAIRMALEDICGAKLFEINSMSSRAKLLRLMDKAAQALRQALAQPEQEPYGWISNEDGWFRKHEIADLTFKNDAIPLYTAPPKREWVGLTDEEISKWGPLIQPLVRAIEAKLKEKNT